MILPVQRVTSFLLGQWKCFGTRYEAVAVQHGDCIYCHRMVQFQSIVLGAFELSKTYMSTVWELFSNSLWFIKDDLKGC